MTQKTVKSIETKDYELCLSEDHKGVYTVTYTDFHTGKVETCNGIKDLTMALYVFDVTYTPRSH